MYLFFDLCVILGFWVSKQCFLSFSTQSHAESYGNYSKKSVWDPKHIKLSENIFQMHFYENIVLGIQTVFVCSFNVLLSYLAEK